MPTSSLKMLIFSNDKMGSLYRSILSIVEPISLTTIYRTIIEESSRLVEAEYGAIFMMKDGLLKRVYSTVPHEYEVQPRERGYSYKSYRDRRIYVFSEKEIKTLYSHMRHTKSLVLIPLFHGSESLGVLALRSSRTFHFDKKKIDILKLFASVAGLKIRNTSLHSVN